jgi:hypothetical protein
MYVFVYVDFSVIKKNRKAYYIKLEKLCVRCAVANVQTAMWSASGAGGLSPPTSAMLHFRIRETICPRGQEI